MMICKAIGIMHKTHATNCNAHTRYAQLFQTNATRNKKNIILHILRAFAFRKSSKVARKGGEKNFSRRAVQSMTSVDKGKIETECLCNRERSLSEISAFLRSKEEKRKKKQKNAMGGMRKSMQEKLGTQCQMVLRKLVVVVIP